MLTDLLLPLGWDDTWSAAYARRLAARPHDDGAPRAVGRVARTDVRSCDVLLPADGALTTVRAAWHPRLARAAADDPTAAPVAGDWVVVAEAAQAHAAHRLETVLPRRTSLVRAQADGSSHGQVLAANADVVAVVEAVDPDLDLGRLERLLALAWTSGARPVVVLTKTDRARHPEVLVREAEGVAPGVEVVPVATPLGRGLEPLRTLLAHRATVALVGASGVGKSTLLNALVADDPTGGPMATRSLGAANKGRHTTVTRELHPGPDGGAVLDTPGLRSVGLVGGSATASAFQDVEDLAARCRFGDCAHETEPGCAVLAAVTDGRLAERRLASWRRLGREALWQAARTDARLAAELHRERRRDGAVRRRVRPRP